MCYDRNPAYIRKVTLIVGKINNQHHAFNAKFNISKVIQNCSLKVLKQTLSIHNKKYYQFSVSEASLLTRGIHGQYV